MMENIAKYLFVLASFCVFTIEGFRNGALDDFDPSGFQGPDILQPQDELHFHGLGKRFTVIPSAKIEFGRGEPPGECMSSGTFPTYDNCSTYIDCKLGKPPERRTCPSNLHFNALTSHCDFPRNANCENVCPSRNVLYPVSSKCDTYVVCDKDGNKLERCSGGMQLNTFINQCEPTPQANCALSCPKQNALHAIPGKCNLYVECRNNAIEVRKCPRNLHFDPLRKICDYPRLAKCNVVCPEKEGKFPVWGVCNVHIKCVDRQASLKFCTAGLYYDFFTSSCVQREKSTCEIKCPHPNGFFPVPGVCSNFIKCIKYVPTVHRCPENMHFNPILKQCDIAEKANCAIKCIYPGKKFPVHGTCNYYALCTWSSPKIMKCPDGLTFHPLIEDCVTQQKYPCVPQSFIKCPKPNGVFPVPGICHLFIRCFDGKPKLQSCPYGLHYSERAKTCDFADRADCRLLCRYDSDYQLVQGDCNAFAECSRGKPTVMFCDNGKHFNINTRSCENPSKAGCLNLCPTEYGYFPKSGHCESYIHCHRGIPTELRCPEGLHFNPDLLVCDIPKNAGCKS